MTEAIRDQNRKTVGLGVSTADSTVTLPLKIDSATGRLLMNDADPVLKRAYKTSTEIVNNSDTLQNDDDLKFTVAANEVWAIELFAVFDSGATPDINMSFSVPSGTTGFYALASSTITQTITEEHFKSGGGAGFERQLFVRGVAVVGSNAGTVNFQWAQNTADESDTKVLAGSWLIATKLA